MKKFKVWLKENALFLILGITLLTMATLQCALQIPEWAVIAMGCFELILMAILFSYILWRYKMNQQKIEEEKEEKKHGTV